MKVFLKRATLPFLTIFLSFLILFHYIPFSGVNAISEVDKLQQEINKLEELKTLSENATKPLEEELSSLESRISSARSGINAAKAKSVQLAEDIKDREDDLAYHYLLFSNRIAESYKRIRTFNPLTLFLSSHSASQLTKNLVYQESARAQDDRLIKTISEELIQLNDDKKELEDTQVRLASLEKQLDSQASFFKGEIDKAKSYQKELSGQIAALSAKQQDILNKKSGTFQTTVGDVPLADDPASRPDYNPGFSPAFAAFSFGAPHFKGMSQYGAYGRAKSGQSAEQILKAYYGNGIEIKKDYSTGINITVTGYGTVDIETYVKRIYEVPNSWGDNGGMEALKAQAVAARSYALARTNNGASPICATEACQVYKGSNKGGNWEAAVNATRGWVLIAGGQPFSAWYASTSGGYQESYSDNGHSTPGFWDAVGGRSGWTGQAYEKIAGSPWFYKAWYKSRSGEQCEKSHPWLTSSEMADILNAWVVLVKHGQNDDRITPNSSCWGGDPYSMDELRQKAASLGTVYSSVSGVSVSYSDSGYTASVTFQTDKGSVTLNGLDFYKVFNLRAPGRISLKSGLFNIEKK